MGSPTTGKLPCGDLDRADGINYGMGTATPIGAIGAATAAGDVVDFDGFPCIPIEELPDSPEIEMGEQETIIKRFRMNWYEAQRQALINTRGTILTDTFGNNFRVLSCKAVHEKPNNGILTIVQESLNTDTPPDQFEVNPVDLGVNIIKFPRYFYSFNPTPAQDPGSFEIEGGATIPSYIGDALLNQSVIRVLQNYFEITTAAYRDALLLQLYLSLGAGNEGTIASDGQTVIPGDPFIYDLTAGEIVPASDSGGDTFITVYPIPGTDIAKYAALEIIQKYWRNEETPYIVGYEVTQMSYFWLPQKLNPGGYIEDPWLNATPQIPDEFWSTGPSDPTDPTSALGSIFDQLAHYNPQCYSSDGTQYGDVVISWLRKADRVDQTQRTWIKIYRSWMGTPIGFWDSDLYNQLARPGNNNPNDNFGFDVPSIPSLQPADVTTANISTFQIIANP